MATPLPLFKFHWSKLDGTPAANWTVTTYLAGTSTLTLTFVDADESSQNTSTITLDSRGEANIWLDEGVSYKFVIKDVAGDTQETIDDISVARIVATSAYANNAHLDDENTNELVTFGVVSSAINNVKITNAAAGNAPMLSAIGGDTNINFLYQTKGTGVHKWLDGNGNEVLVSGVGTASAVNEITVTNAATGSNATLSATGGDADRGITLKAKGDGQHALVDSSGNEIIKTAAGIASAVNEATFQNAATGNNPQIQATGGDANVGLDFIGKGTGVFNWEYNSSTVLTVGSVFTYSSSGNIDLTSSAGTFTVSSSGAVSLTSTAAGASITATTTTIKDVNGNEVLQAEAAVASAVNYASLTNAATATNPIYAVAGSDTNIGFDFQAKGTGTYNFLATADTSTIIRLFEDTDNGTNYVGLKCPASLSASYDFQLPTTDGDADQVLATDGSGNTSWTTPPAADGDVVLVQLQTASASASIQFTGISSTYNSYFVVISNLKMSTDANLYFRTSANGGSSYDSGASNYHYSGLRFSQAASASAGSTGATLIAITNDSGGATANEEVASTVTIFNPSAAKYCRVTASSSYISTSGEPVGEESTGARLSAAAVDAIQFLPSTGTFTTGTFALYARKAT